MPKSVPSLLQRGIIEEVIDGRGGVEGVIEREEIILFHERGLQEVIIPDLDGEDIALPFRSAVGVERDGEDAVFHRGRSDGACADLLQGIRRIRIGDGSRADLRIIMKGLEFKADDLIRIAISLDPGRGKAEIEVRIGARGVFFDPKSVQPERPDIVLGIEVSLIIAGPHLVLSDIGLDLPVSS